jgi:hypothetical protein
MLIQGIPVMGAWFRRDSESIRIGTATVSDKQVTLELSGETLDKVLELVQDGAEVKAFHVEVEMMAARKKDV